MYILHRYISYQVMYIQYISSHVRWYTYSIYPLMSGGIHTVYILSCQVVYGRWLISGYPKLVLFDLGSAWYKLAEWRKEFWELASIGWPDEDTESNNALVLGNLVCWFISEVSALEEWAWLSVEEWACLYLYRVKNQCWYWIIDFLHYYIQFNSSNI